MTELNSWKVIQLLVCSNFETFKCFLYLGAIKCVWLCENKCLIKCLCEKLCMCWQGCCRFLATVCPRHCRGKESACQCRISKRYRFHPWVRKIPWRREWVPTLVFLPGKSHGLYSPWSRRESDTTEQLSLSHFNLCTPVFIATQFTIARI